MFDVLSDAEFQKIILHFVRTYLFGINLCVSIEKKCKLVFRFFFNLEDCEVMTMTAKKLYKRNSSSYGDICHGWTSLSFYDPEK